jgi:hypothetical protein
LWSQRAVVNSDFDSRSDRIGVPGTASISRFLDANQRFPLQSAHGAG